MTLMEVIHIPITLIMLPPTHIVTGIHHASICWKWFANGASPKWTLCGLHPRAWVIFSAVMLHPHFVGVVAGSHHNLLMPGHGYVGSFEQFMEFFKEGLHVFGSYWHHILGGWKNRDHKNLKFMWFEDMKKDQKGVIKELCDFLDHPLPEDLMDRLCDHVKFENMKKNPHANPSGALHLLGNKDKSFMRKGEVGDWKNFFDDERNSTWNRWIKQNIEGTGLEQVEYLKFS